MKNETLNEKKAEVSVEEVLIKSDVQPKKTFSLSSLKNLYSLRDVPIIFISAVLFLIAYFILFPSRGTVSSDSVDTLMWAQASFDSHSLFSKDFSYACLLPFGGQLLMIPLIALFGVTMTTQVLGMLAFFILFTVALFLMLRQMHWGSGWSCFAVSCTLMLLSGSDKLREIFWGHIIYYSLGIFFMYVGFAFVFKVINLMTPDQITRKFWIFSGLLFIWCLLTATDQLEALTIFSVPAIGAIIGERFFSFKKMTKIEKQSNLILIATTILGTGIGYIIGILLKRGFTAGYESAYSTFSPPNLWFQNLSNFFSEWSTLLGVNIADNDPIMSGKGIVNLIMLVLCFVLLIAPVVATIFYPKIKDRASRIVILYHWIMSALIMMGFVFGKLSAANWRLSPILCSSVLVTIIFCRWVYAQTDKRRLVWIMILPVLFTGLNSLYTISKMPSNYNQDQGLYRISKTLEQNNLSYGYATFWNANALTVVSDSKVKVRNIDINNSAITKDSYQSQNSWYKDQPGQDTYFVLASAQEYQTMQKNNNPLIGKAVKTIPTDNYTILVFNENIINQ